MVTTHFDLVSDPFFVGIFLSGCKAYQPLRTCIILICAPANYRTVHLVIFVDEVILRLSMNLFQLCLAHAPCTMGSQRMSVALWVLVSPLPHGKSLLCPFLQLPAERFLCAWPCQPYWFKTLETCELEIFKRRIVNFLFD